MPTIDLSVSTTMKLANCNEHYRQGDVAELLQITKGKIGSFKSLKNRAPYIDYIFSLGNCIFGIGSLT